jgi:hypothetical protein
LIAINNMPDHLHLLVGLRPDSSLSDLVRDVKAGSSKFINERYWVIGRFSWQEGFGAFSYSRSQLGTVIRYIENQQRHHAKQSFRDEYVALLEKSAWNTTRDTFSKPARNDLWNMPLLTELEIWLGLVSTKMSCLRRWLRHVICGECHDGRLCLNRRVGVVTLQRDLCFGRRLKNFWKNLSNWKTNWNRLSYLLLRRSLATQEFISMLRRKSAAKENRKISLMAIC